MVVENRISEFDDLLIIDEAEKDDVLFRLYEGRIYYVLVKKGKRFTMEDVQNGYEFVRKQEQKEFYNIFHFESFAEVDPEVRAWAADPSGNDHTIIDAIVISNLPQKILADFYLRFNKPQKSTKLFSTLQKAYAWVLEQKESGE